MNDLDELEQEEKERQAKKKLSERFFTFARNVEAQSKKSSDPIEFDVPIQDLFFQGCPMKQSVKVRPTRKNCIISISEFPFFVINVDEIEAVHFERVSFGIKNFDMAIIFKDFQTFKRINSIPRESIDEVKGYLDSVGVIYSEGIVPINWNAVLEQIRSDFDDFLKNGAWRFLRTDDGDSEEDEDELQEDSEFNSAAGSSSEDDDDSQFSDEDDDDYSSEADDDESEGLSWDEHEKQALEEERRNAVR